MENLADAVFGFALTLLVVSTAVPMDFDGLKDVLRGFPAFAACFAILLLFWNEHYKFSAVTDWRTSSPARSTISSCCWCCSRFIR